MGIIKKWIINRRLKKIEAIERELERIVDNKLAKHAPKNESLKSALIDPETKKLVLKNQFIKTDSSFFLLFIVCLVTAALIGSTAFYQVKMSKLNTDFTASVVEIDKLKQELSLKESNLGEVQETLSIKSQREEELEDAFSTERKKLKDEINLLKSEKADLQSEVNQLETKIKQLEDENAVLEERLNNQ